MPSNMTNSTTSTKETVHQMQNKGKVFKIIVIGDSSVGKTTLTYRFCEGKFLNAAEATIGVDFRTRTVHLNDEAITLQLWDTAGQERFRNTMIRHYYKNAHAIIFVYDVTNASTFDSLKKWIEESNTHCPLDIPRILVGNKCDGISVVTTNVAQKFADQNQMPLFETSAKLDSHCDNVDSIFLTLAHKLKNQKYFLQPISTVKITGAVLEDKGSKSGWCC